MVHQYSDPLSSFNSSFTFCLCHGASEQALLGKRMFCLAASQHQDAESAPYRPVFLLARHQPTDQSENEPAGQHS